LQVDTDVLVGTLDYGELRVATGTMGCSTARLITTRPGGRHGRQLPAQDHSARDCTPRVCELVRYHCRT
jgi:acetoacetate decarboxylase